MTIDLSILILTLNFQLLQYQSQYVFHIPRQVKQWAGLMVRKWSAHEEQEESFACVRVAVYLVTDIIWGHVLPRCAASRLVTIRRIRKKGNPRRFSHTRTVIGLTAGREDSADCRIFVEPIVTSKKSA